ncbi:MAG TPA: helix-turn-helix transcriptional regulator [Xanthobacteraceae bacterium]|nr:helix-turn-helix transcriptional regulator [Xanthobacteraceae bacterium]
MSKAIELDDLSDVIGTIYDCAVDPQHWPQAIESIARLIDGDHGIILVFDTIRNEPRLYKDWNVDAESMRLYRKKYHQENPIHEGFSSFDIDQPYNIPAVIDPAEFMKSRVYTEFGQPRGWLDNVGVSIMKTPTRIASLSVIRPIEAGWAGPRELEILRLLSPHVRRAVSISDLFDMQALAATAFESTLDGLAVPIVLADSKGVIAHANAGARALLAAGDPITSEHSVLRASAASAAGALAAAIAQTAQPETMMGKVGIDVPVPYTDGRPGFAHVLPVGRGAVRGALGPGATAAVFFTPSAEPQPLPAAAWAATFGFTSAEMWMLDLLVKGHTVAEAAGIMGVAEPTARTHVANLMAKAGTNRQADLIKLALRLAPPVRGAQR